MTEENERQSIAFIRSLANLCGTCYRHYNCDECPSSWAKRILSDIEREQKKSTAIDYTLHARIIKILATMYNKTPMFSASIKLNNICSNQLKLWTLKKMCQLGLISRSLNGVKSNVFYKYKLTKKGKKYYENHIIRTGECKKN